jgi:hypothetical protein
MPRCGGLFAPRGSLVLFATIWTAITREIEKGLPFFKHIWTYISLREKHSTIGLWPRRNLAEPTTRQKAKTKEKKSHPDKP